MANVLRVPERAIDLAWGFR